MSQEDANKKAQQANNDNNNGASQATNNNGNNTKEPAATPSSSSSSVQKPSRFANLPSDLPRPIGIFELAQYRLQAMTNSPARHWKYRKLFLIAVTAAMISGCIFYYWRDFRRWKLRERERREERKHKEGVFSLQMLEYYRPREEEAGIISQEQVRLDAQKLQKINAELGIVESFSKAEEDAYTRAFLREVLGTTELPMIDIERWPSTSQENNYMKIERYPLVKQAIRVKEKLDKLQHELRLDEKNAKK